MPRLIWDERNYESGLDRGVFYPPNASAEPWNGLISVEESSETLKDLVRYRDGIKIGNHKKPDSYSATVQAYTYPASFHDHIVSRRLRSTFGFSYRTRTALGDRIHLIYNVHAQMNERTYEQEEPTPFQWSFSTKPTAVPEALATAHLIVDASKTNPNTLVKIEDQLYGSEEVSAHLLTPQETFDIFEADAVLKVVDHGDGTFTVTGPDDAIEMVSPTEFRITWPSAVYLDESTYTIRSL